MTGSSRQRLLILAHVHLIYRHHELCPNRTYNRRHFVGPYWLKAKRGVRQGNPMASDLCGANGRDCEARSLLWYARRYYGEYDLNRSDHADAVRLLTKMADVLLLSMGFLSREPNLLVWRSIILSKNQVQNHGCRKIHLTNTVNGCRQRVVGC